jgi:hypothetical protein
MNLVQPVQRDIGAKQAEQALLGLKRMHEAAGADCFREAHGHGSDMGADLEDTVTGAEQRHQAAQLLFRPFAIAGDDHADSIA